MWAGALFLSVLIVVVRGRPRLTGDPGVFLTVAGRLLDGYRLYSGVFDNKDPLFLYEYALALWVGGWRAPFLLDALWLSIGMVSMGYLLRLMRLPTRVQITTAVAFGLSLTGPWYYAGFSMLPSLALAPLPAALWLREHQVAAGAVLSLAVLLKLNVALVVATPLLVLLLLAPQAHRISKRAGIRLILGLAVPVVALVSVLLVRGELVPYVQMLRENVGYPGRALESRGYPAGAKGHLDLVKDMFGRAFAPACVLGLAALALGGLSLARHRHDRGAERLTAALLVGSVVTTSITIATTALWNHHLQVLAIPIAFAVAYLAVGAASFRGPRLSLVACISLLVLLSLASPARVMEPLDLWTSTPTSETAHALVRARNAAFGPGASASYARFGGNGDPAHGAFIDDSLHLACPRFHQYPWVPHLQAVFACVEKRRPQLVLVTTTFLSSDGSDATPAWRTFVSSARRLLADEYVKVETRPEFEIWRIRRR